MPLTSPLYSLLGFAVWTLLVVLVGVGTPRVTAVLARRAPPKSFRADEPHGSERYRRTMRAHANCIENLPLFTVVVFALHATGASSPLADALAAIALGARVLQSLVHIATVQTDRVVTVRFSFFFIQLLCFIGIAGIVVAGVT